MRLGLTDLPFYLLAALAGAAIGYADVTINDLLFTALLVLASCMLLGLLRPRWPWRWVVVVALCIPLSRTCCVSCHAGPPTRGQIYGSFLTALPVLLALTAER